MGAVWRLIEAHQASQKYRPSIRSIAQAAEVKPSTLAKWQDLRSMPESQHLRAVARTIGVTYTVMLNAALEDAGYRDPLPEGVDWADLALAANEGERDVSPDA